MNSRQTLGLVALLWFGSEGSAVAQAAPRSLTERDAVAAAVVQNPTLHVALLRASQDRFAVLAEQGLYAPTFNASAGYTHTRTPSLYDVPAMGTMEARYETRVAGHDATFLLAVENVGDRNYWASALGSALTLADPLTVKATARVRF